MREIKFRAWNCDFNWFEENFFVSAFDGTGYDTPSFTYDTPNIEIEEQQNYIIEQFTGIKDRNGVDIYEGDIIADFEYQDGYSPQILEVFFDSGSFMVKEFGFIERLIEFEGSCEVIGNIHQNPDLLK